MKICYFFSFYLLTSGILFSQDCNCKHLLREIYKKVESNYAGYHDKITSTNKQSYNQLKGRLLKKASSGKVQCIEVIDEFLYFFKDPHTILNQENAVLIKDTSLKLTNPSNPQKTIEGMWYNTQNESSIYIQKKGNRYLGYVVNPSDTNFGFGTLQFDLKNVSNNRYRGILYNKHKQKIIYEVSHERDQLVVQFLATYTRSNQTTKLERSFIFKMLNDSVSYIKLPSFSSFYRKLCDSLVESNRREIERSKYLIIDVRDNGGGTIYSFSKVFDYIYTNPTGFVSGFYFASSENIAKAKESLERAKKYLDSSQIRSREKFIRQLESSAGKLYFEPPDTLRRKNVYITPQKIVILANNNTGSAAEMFIIMAKQNKKTILAGTRTAGASDYLEPLLYNFCNDEFVIGIPWIKRTRLEYKQDIDNVGIKPDYSIANAPDQWVEFVVNKILSRND